MICPMDPTPDKSMVRLRSPLHCWFPRRDSNVVGDGGGFSGGGYSGGSDFQDRPSRSAQYEEYDEFDDGGARAPPPPPRSSVPRRSTPKKELPTPKKEVDLFNFDDDVPPPMPSTSNGKGKEIDTGADDDFDDFQSATGTSATTTTAAPSTIMSAYSAPPMQSRPSAPTSTGSFSSTFTNLSISTPPISQATRSPNPQTSFGVPPPTMGKPLTSPLSSQPNYFSQPPAPTTVPIPQTPERMFLTVVDSCNGETFCGCVW